MNIIDALRELPSEFGIKAAHAQGGLKSADAFTVQQSVSCLDGLAANAAMIGEGHSTPPMLNGMTDADRTTFKNAAEYLRALADHGRDRIRELSGK